MVDDLPHFLLLLLILLRFNDTKWGYFTDCPQSGVRLELKEKTVAYSFVADKAIGERITVISHSQLHNIHLGNTLIGRGTSVIGRRMGPLLESMGLGDATKLREGNDLVIKTYWPEEKRTSEVEILKKAREYGENIDFIGKYIPGMVCHLDPNFLCSSTKTIRQFLGLSTNGSRHLRMIAFRQLLPIKRLKEKDVLTAYSQCFFHEYDGPSWVHF